MKLASFLGRYFRRYSAWGLVALVATLLFALSTVALLPVFQLILSDVIKTDKVVLGDSGGGAAEQEEAGDRPHEAFLRRLGVDVDLDLKALLDRTWSDLRRRWGIDDNNVVWYLPILFVCVFFTRSLSAFANGYLFQVIGLGATNDLRNSLYERILHQSSRFYAEHPSGELVSRVGNDIAVMQNAVSQRLLDLLQQSVTLIFLVTYLLLINFRLAVICLVVVPAIFFPIVRFGQGMRRKSRESQERLADLANLVAEAVRGHRVVKAFGMEAFELDRFRRATRRHLKVKLRAQLLANASSPVVESLAVLGGMTFLIYVGFAVRDATLVPSQIMAFLSGLVMLYDPIRKLNKVNLVLQEALAAGQRVHDVMAIPNDITDRPGARVLDAVTPRIAYENVTFGYDGGETAVLRGVDLVIEPGEIVALVGASGAGKSTLVNLLPRFFDPSGGRVVVGGHDLRDIGLASLRSQLGIVTQDTVLFNDTVRNNIAYGRSDLSLEKVREAAAAAFADEFILEMPEGYDTRIGEGGLKLSGGQRQRLAIARALLKNPPILILDEATSHLDSEAEALVQKALYNLMEGRTALVIAHRLSTVKRADRILVMEAGEVVEEGAHEELLKKDGRYQRLYKLQFQDL